MRHPDKKSYHAPTLKSFGSAEEVLAHFAEKGDLEAFAQVLKLATQDHSGCDQITESERRPKRANER